MCVPGTDVGIARNGPPVSVFGLGSHVSSWLTPPCRKIFSTRLCDELLAPRAGVTSRPPMPAARPPPTRPPNSDRRESVWSGVRHAYVHGIGSELRIGRSPSG